MLKAKPIKGKQKKAPKAKKPRVKKTLPIHEGYQASHRKTDQITTQGFFNPFTHNTGMAQSSNIPIARMTGGGIPYTSTFESYGITNKPPYFLESFIPQNIRPNYEMPKQSKTATTISGANPMNEAKPKDFKEQGKLQNIQYVDLVEPSKVGNSETQPDYITIETDIMGNIQPANKMKNELMERVEYRKKNNIPPEKKISSLMFQEKNNKKRKNTLRETEEKPQGPPEKSNEFRKK
jgi:hypothetical protein